MEGDKEKLLPENSNEDCPSVTALPSSFPEAKLDSKIQVREGSDCDVEAKVIPLPAGKPLPKQNVELYNRVDVCSDALVDNKRQPSINEVDVVRQTLGYFQNISSPVNEYIHGLPNELLEHIFSYLDIRQRIATELVCKRWRLLGKYVTWSEPKRLIFDPWYRRENTTKGKWALDDYKFEAILSRCGQSVRHMALFKVDRPKNNPNFRVLVTDDCLKSIAAHCPNLETLRLKRIRLNRYNLKHLAEGCRKLKNVTFSVFGVSDEGFSDFYVRCQSLESLTIEPDHRTLENLPLLELLEITSVHGQGFNCLSPNLQVLNLIKCENLQSTSLQNVVKTCHCIRALHLTVLFPDSVKSDLLMSMCHHYKNTLKVLEFHLPIKAFNWCRALRMLCKLEEFHLHMQGIVLGCPCYRINRCFAKLSPNLKVVSASDASILSTSNEEYILSKLLVNAQNFEELRFPRSNLSPETLKLISKHGDTLKKLDLRHYDTKNCNWCQFFPKLPNLEDLRLTHCSEVDDDLATVWASNCRHLKVLRISSTSITDQGIVQLASLPNLTELDLSDCGGITDDGMEILAAHGRIEVLHLATISISINVTDAGCSALASFCPHFRLLDVSNTKGTKKITDKLVAAFRKSKREGFLREVVELIVGGTAVRDHVETCDGLEVYFSCYQRIKYPNEYQGFLDEVGL